MRDQARMKVVRLMKILNDWLAAIRTRLDAIRSKPQR
jgi:hypothetical protein